MTTRLASLPPLPLRRSVPVKTKVDSGLLIAAALFVTVLIVEAAILITAHHAASDISAITATVT